MIINLHFHEKNKNKYLTNRDYFFKGTSATRFIIKKIVFYFFFMRKYVIDYLYVYTSKNCDINHHISI